MRKGKGVVGRRVTIEGERGALGGEWIIVGLVGDGYQLKREDSAATAFTAAEFGRVKFVRRDYR